jgi:hypothetical protein
MEHDTDLAARLARLEARRQTARPTAGTVSSPRRRRPHAARRSRIGVTVGSAMAMVGLTGAMALADQAASASAPVVTDATVSTQSSGSSSSSSSVATTVTAAAAATPSTTVATQSNGS